jgi:predicted murein hydrolase (TIGR00659 family)
MIGATLQTLAASALGALTLTLMAWMLALALAQRMQHPLCNPVALAMVLVVLGLWASGTAYADYFAGAQPLHLLLGPATVALAVPMAARRADLLRLRRPLALGLLAGGTASTVSALLIAKALGASPALLATLAPKSLTTPIAVGVAQRLGGIPALTAVCCIVTGMIGAAMGPAVFRTLGVHDERAQGYALGMAAHGVGAASAFRIGPAAGAFAGLALGLHGLVGAWVLPVLVPFWLH